MSSFELSVSCVFVFDRATVDLIIYSVVSDSISTILIFSATSTHHAK